MKEYNQNRYSNHSSAIGMEDSQPTQQNQYYQPKELIVFKKKKGIYNKFQYKSYSRKLGRLRKKYQGIAKNFQIVEKQGAEEQIRKTISNDNEFKNLVLQADPILQQTYSYKYFGVNNGQFGILSRRLPFQQRKEIEPMRKTFSIQCKTKGQYRLIQNEQNTTMSNKNQQLQNLKEYQTTTSQGFGRIQMSKTNQKPGQKQDNMQSEEQESNKIRSNIPKINPDESHMVTQYFLPNKLQAIQSENKRLLRSKSQYTFPNLDKNSKMVKGQMNFIRRRKNIQLMKLQRGAYRNYGFSLTYLKQKKLQESRRMKKLLSADFPKAQEKIKHKTSYSQCLSRLNNFLDENKYGIHEFMLHKDILNYQKDKRRVPKHQQYRYFLKVLSTTDENAKKQEQ